MGLDAIVRCRCWENGKISSPPPHISNVKVDEEDNLVLDLPWQDNRDKHDSFDDWIEHCCTHPRMEQARERISNWGGYRQFQSQLMEFGIDQFPTLRDMLPKSNGGHVPADRSRAALAELDDFSLRQFGSKVVLVDAAAGDELYEYIPIYEGVFMLAPGNWDGGVDLRGFFVRGPQGIPGLFEKQQEIRRLQERNTDLQRDVQRKRERIARLKNSPSEQEMEIRKKLKMLRPGEIEFILPEDNSKK